MTNKALQDELEKEKAARLAAEKEIAALKEELGRHGSGTDADRDTDVIFQTQRKFYEQILNNIPTDIAVFSPDHRYMFLNPVAISKPELRQWMIGKNDRDYCLQTGKPVSIAEDRERVFREVIESRSLKEWEEKLTNKQGEDECHLRRLYPVMDEHGTIELVIGYGMNITELKKKEVQIKLSEKRYRDLFNFSQAWICTHDLDGRLMSINPAACRILEFAEHELLGRKISDLIPENVRQQFDDQYLTNIVTDHKAEGIMSIMSKKGKKIFLLYQNYLVTEAGGNPYVVGFAQNITERIYADEALKRSEERARSIIDNMNLGMIEIDTKERIIYANQRFCKMSGYDLNELVTQKATDLLLQGTRLKIISGQISRRQYGVANNYEVTVKTKMGESRIWLTSAAPLFNPDGSVRGTVGIHLDITEQKKLEQQLREAKLDADRASKSKDIFLTNMSHEIRTPLNAIMGLGKLLGKSDLSEQQKNYLNGIESASENLLGIINDLLDFSKIEAGKISIENISFNLETVARQTINILTHKAEEKGLSLVFEADDRIAPVLMGDPFRIKQVFMNMLGNALKFTEKGSISLKAMLLDETEDHQRIRISIIDTGIGIKEEYLENLFDKFTQEDATVARKFGGTGLGMSITKQLMELMGGSIKVESRKNIGTTISLFFNLKIGTARVIEKKRTIKNETGSISNKRILLVEDNNLNRLLAHTILTDYGAHVTEAVNGQEAVDVMREQEFDMVLMDIQMPVMDGIEATRIIRKEIDRNVPIIALTANAIKSKLDQFMSAGMNDHILKPYDELTLVNPIARWLSRQGTSEPVRTPAASQPEVAAPAEQIAPDAGEALYDLTALKAISRNDDDFIRKMLKLFVDETPDATVKIKEALQAGDLKTVKYYAHRVKPSILNMGIAAVKDDIVKIELIAEKGEFDPSLDPMVGKLYDVISKVVDQLRKEYGL